MRAALHDRRGGIAPAPPEDRPAAFTGRVPGVDEVRLPAPLVVWSTITAPSASTGSASATTWRTSSSLPTHSTSTSAPRAASAAVSPRRPPWTSTHRRAFSGLRLKTDTSWPALARCPAIGKPITPRPANATFILLSSSCCAATPS